MEYYIYETQENDRWDTIATKFYGNCYLINPIIEANFHVQITPVLKAGTEIRIPITENKTTLQGVPLWKQ